MIPKITDQMGRHWRKPADIREAPMDDKHVLLSRRQIAELPDYSRSYPSGTYDGKCWKREGKGCWYLCWYEPHATPEQIGIGFRIILEVESSAADQTGGAQ